MHPGCQWEVMSDGFYAVEFGRGRTVAAIHIPKGSILMVLKSGDPERPGAVRFSLAGRKYWTFTAQFHSHCELKSNPAPAPG
jgi:hypothetical protein